MKQFPQIINTRIRLITFSALINEIHILYKGYICFANVHMVVEGYKNKDFQEIINNSTYTVPDGVPIQKSLKLLYGISQERIAGMDFMPALIRKATKEVLSAFFFGSDLETNNAIKKKASIENPNLKIAGSISPPFRPISDAENKDHINQINKSGAKIVFVCLGCPKQEIWMAENTEKINAVLLGVGGAFETYAETKKRAPRWIRNISMEWVYRLGQDPKRMWKRYFITNSLFLHLLVKQFIKVRFLHKRKN